jgi:transposase-like protein
VLEGLKGRPIGELCAEHEISQAQYYQWRDQFLATPRKRSSRPVYRSARAGSNAKMRGSGPGRRSPPPP